MRFYDAIYNSTDDFFTLSFISDENPMKINHRPIIYIFYAYSFRKKYYPNILQEVLFIHRRETGLTLAIRNQELKYKDVPKAIAWSSLIDPTDFTPSLVTGAGGGAVQGAKGDIVCCVSHTIGLVIYTNQNAVAAPTSGNARYPFNFRELVASGGIASSI